MIESERICLPESAARSSLQYVRPDKTAEGKSNVCCWGQIWEILTFFFVATSYYQPTPPPQTVVVHSIPKKTNDACCWGW